MSDITTADVHTPAPEVVAPATTSGWRARLASGQLALLFVAGILIVGAFLRLTHIDWDEGAHIHPDERFLTFVVDAMALPANFGEFMDSTRSPMSPYNTGHGFFVYGTLPLFIVRVAAEFINRLNLDRHWWMVAEGIPVDFLGYGGIHLAGRALSGLFDLACIPLIFWIGRRLYDWRIGILGALFYAFAVLPLQQSHFFTVDTFGTFFALLTFYLAVRVMQGGLRGHGGGWGVYLAMGASLGATVASRINLAPMAGIVLLAAAVRAWDDWHAGRRADDAAHDERWLSAVVQATLFRLLVMGLVTVAVFRVAQPYAFGGTSILDFSFADQWRDNMRVVRLLMSGDADSPPGHQWASRTPFVFPFVNMVFWGLGVPLGVAAWAGFAVAAFRLIRGMTLRADPAAVRAHILPVAWIGGMFFWQGLQYVQSMRYLLPIYPLLCVMAAWLLWRGVDAARARASRPLTGAAYAVLAGVTIATMLWGWGFLAIYRRPLSRNTASRWIYANIPSGSVIANEHWDDGLPLRVDGKDGFGGFGYRGLSSASDGSMQMYNEDTPEKREQLYQWLDEADYIVLSSNRLWGSIPRLPLRYPMTTRYYQALFDGSLGFEQVARFTSFPTIFGIEFDDTWAEEAFSVYDHPEVRIFKKTSEYSETLARALFDPIDLEHTIQYWPKQVSAAPTALLMPEADALLQQAGGTWSRIFDPDSALNRSPLLAAAVWLLLLTMLGIVAFPFAFVVLRPLGDRGYGFAKTVGVVLLAWLSWLGPSFRLARYTRPYILVCLLALVILSALVGWRRRREIAAFVRQRIGLLALEEGLFLAFFLLFLLIRWGNPDLWHPARGGEKPMDFAYLNAVIRSTVFPPYDPWYAGGFINYYYFGFVIIGTLVKLTGIVPWVAYNLAVPSLFALVGVGAFSVAYNLAEGDDDMDPAGVLPPGNGLAARPVLAGIAGAFFVAIAGNLGNVRLLANQLAAAAPADASLTGPLLRLRMIAAGLSAVLSGKTGLSFPNDWWFWNASRVIPDTINEFPFFTFTYADLHAHMIAFPLFLLGLCAATALVRNRPAHSTLEARLGPWHIARTDVALLALLGFVAGLLRATNTWDFPTVLIIAGIAVVLQEVSGDRYHSLPADAETRLVYLFHRSVAVVWRLIVVVVVAMLVSYPFGKDYATAYGGLESWREPRTQLGDYLIVHGLFLTLAVIFLMGELVQQIRLKRIPEWLEDLGPALLALIILAGGLGWVLKARVWLVALPLAALAVALAFGHGLPAVRRLTLLLLALALAITVGVEVIRLRDDIGRMNTVFKFYLQAWMLFSVSAAVGLAALPVRAPTWRRGWRWLAWGAVAVMIAGALIYPPTAARAKIRDRFSAQVSPRGLDGMAYMDSAEYFDNNRDLRLADDKAAMNWLMRNVAGSPVILEGNTPGYRWGNRFSIYTGLPAVIGWDWHQRQQRSVVPGAAIDRRLSDVQEIYNTPDLARAQKLLNHYGVEYIIVGELERAYYTPEGLAKFDALVEQGYLERVYPQDDGVVRIYRVMDRGAPLVVPDGEPPLE